MSKTLYLECYSGISGDMTVAALLDLGADPKLLENGLKSLGAEGFQIQISRTKKAGIDACDFSVLLDSVHENHDHDMEYLHGRDGHTPFAVNSMAAHQEHKDASLAHDGGAPHHNHVGHIHAHRGLPEILSMIRQANITDRAKEIACRIFTILGEAEAKAHATALSQVHFHEVGAVDSIVDIVGTAICLDNLDISHVILSELYEGQGTIRCQHGLIPVPVPAVVNIAAAHHLPLHLTSVQGELVTPTGAAIAAALRTKEALPEHFIIEKIGIGAGKRNYETPGILRAMLIREKT